VIIIELNNDEDSSSEKEVVYDLGSGNLAQSVIIAENKE